MVLVPLPHQGRIIGVLKVVSGEADAFVERSVSALRLMGGLLAAAVTHAGEFEIKKKLLAERHRCTGLAPRERRAIPTRL